MEIPAQPLFRGLGSQNHDHIPAFQFCGLLNDTELGASFRKAVHHFLSQFGMLNLAATEAKRNLHFVSATEKAAGVILLRLQIVLFNPNTQLNLFDGNDLLILTGFLFPFGLFKAILAVVHDLTNGRIGLGRDLDQIQSAIVRDLLRVAGGMDPQLRTVGINETNLWVSNFFVQLKFLCADGKTPPIKKKRQNKPVCR